MKRYLIITMLISQISYANSTTTDTTASKAQAKAVMDGVYEAFQKVIPYVYSDEDSLEILKKDPKKKEDLINNLNDLSFFFKSARHVEYFQRPGFRPSLESMNSHLVDTVNSINSNNYAFAQKRLAALTSLCISCHSQLSASGASNAFGTAINSLKRADFKSDYTYGNYLYLIRNFGEAETYFNLSIENALKKSRSAELSTSLKRVVSIHTKIAFNHKNANNFINKYVNDKRLPKLTKNMLKSWRESLEKWQDFDPNQVVSIEDFIKKYLTPLEEIGEQTGKGDNDIPLLISAGVLSKYLNDHPETKSAPQILYWLSVAEKRLGTTYFFTLSELYLKDCIKLYPDSPFARKCYSLYEDNIEFGYTGSSGVDIPPDEKMELARLRKYLK